MGKNSEKDGAFLPETPGRVESSAGKRYIDIITYRRKHWRSEKYITSSRSNEVADSTLPGCRSWNMIPKVVVDVKPSDVPAPVTPVSVTTKQEKNMTPPKKMEASEDVSQKPRLQTASARRSLSLDTRKSKRKGGKDLMFDEASVLLSEDDPEMTEKVRDAKHSDCCQHLLVFQRRRKQVKEQVEKKTTTREKEKIISSSSLSDSGRGIEEHNEGKREWRDKEGELLLKQVKLFISRMRLIQGEMKFSPWKGSVMDSIGGAYLTQNVSDTLSSAAFMSLAAKYPLGAAGEFTPFEASKKKKKNADSRKNIKKGKPVQAEDMCFETQIIYRRKRIKKEDDAMHWNILKECHSKYQSAKKMHETLNALDWDSVRMAQVDDISKAIKIRGMNKHLAGRIKSCLNILEKNFGSTNMEWLRDAPPHQAKEYLLSIFGLGLKSVECVCLLTLRQKAFPIDRNAGRVAVRLGWVPLKRLPQGKEFHLLKEYPTANSVHKYLWPRLSKLDHAILYELHCQMITFAKVFCTKKSPNCNACPMRAECNYFASALASAQLPLLEANCRMPECVREAESQCFCPKCIKMVQASVTDIEDFGRVDDEMSDQNTHKSMNNEDIPPEEGDMSKDLMLLTSEMASIPVPKMKNLTCLRTEHQVYVLPDSHHLLSELEEREPEDSCPYLLAIWTPENLSRDECIPEEDAVYGTILIPARTAMRGMFPLNGTYFQANEVFADDESSDVPIKVPRALLRHLQLTTLYCGNNMSAICRGMKTFQVQECLRRGFVCFRGFNRKTREAKSLSARFHLQAIKAGKPSGDKKKNRRTATELEEDA